MDRPADLRIENRRRLGRIVFSWRGAAVLAVLFGIEVLIAAVSLIGRTDPLGVLALSVRGVVVIGLAIVAWDGRRRSQVEAIEFSDRFRFYERGQPIAYDWNQLSGMWYEGMHNPARVVVTSVKPNASEDRVLVVGLLGGAEVRMRVDAEQQKSVLDWAEFVQQ